MSPAPLHVVRPVPDRTGVPDLTADALVHWLELGIARGVDELARRLARTIDLEPRDDGTHGGEDTMRRTSVHWLQTFSGDLAGTLTVSAETGARRRLGTALSQTFATPREAAGELELQVFNIVLNEVLLTLQGSLDVSLVGSLPRRHVGLREGPHAAVVPFMMGFESDEVPAVLSVRVDASRRVAFERAVQASLTQYLDSFTSWTPP